LAVKARSPKEEHGKGKDWVLKGKSPNMGCFGKACLGGTSQTNQSRKWFCLYEKVERMVVLSQGS